MKHLSVILMAALLFSACNSKSEKKSELFAPSEFKEWAQTPPMGWNSWDCFGPTVEEHEVKANADYMSKHLKDFGWNILWLTSAGLWKTTRQEAITKQTPFMF